MILEEETIELAVDPPPIPIEKLFTQGFEGDEAFGFVSEEPSLATLSMSPLAPAAAPRDEFGPSTKSGMKQVTINVPEGVSLQKKTNWVVVWLNPLTGPLERKKLDSHSLVTLISDIIHSSLKVYLSTLNHFIYSFSRL